VRRQNVELLSARVPVLFLTAGPLRTYLPLETPADDSRGLVNASLFRIGIPGESLVNYIGNLAPESKPSNNTIET
jgi:hypothetical protein